MNVYAIVLGNEKGGSGKSTTVMHLAVALLRRGKRVAVADLDARQGTVTRYFNNRRHHVAEGELNLPMPELLTLRPEDGGGDEAGIEELIEGVIRDVSERHDFIIFDTPGADTVLSRVAHSFADTLITPINDSLVDFDVIARIDPTTMQATGPSHYAELVWRQRLARAKRADGEQATDWVVVRNRMGFTESKNKREMDRLIGEVGQRFGFRTAPGLSERVIFRELFHKGLTLMDLAEIREQGDDKSPLSMSHVAARQEVRALVDALNLVL